MIKNVQKNELNDRQFHQKKKKKKPGIYLLKQQILDV